MVSISAAADTAQGLYQRGLVQEHAKGDLRQAIALYAQAAKAAGTDRALAAKALIREAGAHEKLGARAEADRVYAELLRSYPDQRAEATLAKERLKLLRNKPVSRAVERAPATELAARLAAFIWNGAPDESLLISAKHGELSDPIALNRQVIRMLRSPRSAALVDNFFASWLSFAKVKTDRPDPAMFPEVDAELLEAMDTETRLFVRSQVREDHDAVEIWTAPYTFVNERLARHYGLPGISGKDFRRVTWPDATRAGLLGQAGPLTAHSTGTRTSPTARGIFVMNRFFGLVAPEPPVNIPGLDEQSGDTPKPTRTMRERMLVHRTNPQCASCHAMFDPVGFALENFDATGRWRTTDGGAPIDASGSFQDGTRFNGPDGLRAALVKRRGEYYANVTRQLLAYALQRKGKGGRVYDYEMPAVQQIVHDAAAHGYRWSAIITGIAASAPFQARDVVP